MSLRYKGPKFTRPDSPHKKRRPDNCCDRSQKKDKKNPERKVRKEESQ